MDSSFYLPDAVAFIAGIESHLRMSWALRGRKNWPSWNLEIIQGSSLAGAPGSSLNGPPSVWLHLSPWVGWSQVEFPGRHTLRWNLGTESWREMPLVTIREKEGHRTGQREKLNRKLIAQILSSQWGALEPGWPFWVALNWGKRGWEFIHPHLLVLGSSLVLGRGCPYRWGCRGQFLGSGSGHCHQTLALSETGGMSDSNRKSPPIGFWSPK